MSYISTTNNQSRTIAIAKENPQEITLGGQSKKIDWRQLAPLAHRVDLEKRRRLEPKAAPEQLFFEIRLAGIQLRHLRQRRRNQQLPGVGANAHGHLVNASPQVCESALHHLQGGVDARVDNPAVLDPQQTV